MVTSQSTNFCFFSWLLFEPCCLRVNSKTPSKLPCDETPPVTHSSEEALSFLYSLIMQRRGQNYSMELKLLAGKIIKL